MRKLNVAPAVGRTCFGVQKFRTIRTRPHDTNLCSNPFSYPDGLDSCAQHELRPNDGPRMNRVLVIGPTGNVGREVLSQLTAAGRQVRALTRNTETVRFPSDVELVRGDLTVPESLDRCLEGIDTAFLVWTAPLGTVAPVLGRIAKHARRIVFLSSPHKTAHPLFQKPQPNPTATLHKQIEQWIENSEMEWTFLRPGMLAANALRWWAPQIRAGDVVRWPYLAVPTAPIHERDIAAVAVRALCEDGHARAEYVLTGSQSLTQLEQLSQIGRVIGRSLRIEEISPEQARRKLFNLWPAAVANMLLDAWAGAIGQPAFVTSTVKEITGTPACTFLDWITGHAAEFTASDTN